MLPTRDQQVAVYWDLENCAPPNAVDGYQTVLRLREFTERYGRMMVLRAYAEVNPLSPRSTTLRTELQSSGVTIVDCPHSGLKDVADKMIIVDVAFHAAAYPSDTIVLVTGDRDYAYLVSILRLRRQKVIIIGRPRQIHASLKAHASAILDWDVLTSGKPMVDSFGSSRDGSPRYPPKIPSVGNLVDAIDEYDAFGSMNFIFPSLEPVPQHMSDISRASHLDTTKTVVAQPCYSTAKSDTVRNDIPLEELSVTMPSFDVGVCAT